MYLVIVWVERRYSFFTVIFPSASWEHQLLDVLGRRPVPQSGSLQGLVSVVCILSDLCCRVAAGQSRDYIYSNDQDGWDGLSARHCRWYGWVARLWSATVLLFSSCCVYIIFLDRRLHLTNTDWHSFVHFKCSILILRSLTVAAPNWEDNSGQLENNFFTKPVEKGSVWKMYHQHHHHHPDVSCCHPPLQVLPESLHITVKTFTFSMLLTSWCVFSLSFFFY